MFEGNDDPILNDFLEANGDLFEEGKVEYKEGIERFLKTWHGAELAEVIPVAKGEKQFSYRVKTKWFLTPDDLENLTQVTLSTDLFITPIDNGNSEQYASAVKKSAGGKKRLNSILGQLGVLKPGQIWSRPVDNQQTYDALVEYLKRGVGKRGSIEISRQRRWDKETSKFVNTDFMQFEGVAAK